MSTVIKRALSDLESLNINGMQLTLDERNKTSAVINRKLAKISKTTDIFFYVDNPDTIEGNLFSQELYFKEVKDLDDKSIEESLQRDLNEYMLFETIFEYNATRREYKIYKTFTVKEKIQFLQNEIVKMKYFYCI